MQLKPFVKDNLPVMAEISKEPQVSALMRDNPRETHKYVFILFLGLNESFKIKPELKLTEDEVMELASDLLEDYWHYRVQDFALFVKNAKKGLYGKSYNRLDVPTIREWLVKYDSARTEQSAKRNLNMRISDEFEREAPKHKLNIDKMKKSLSESRIVTMNQEKEKLKEIDKF